MRHKSLKSEGGITLIALVITIVVLLILAGVSISLVVGNNGVLTQASNAVIENRKAEAREDVEMAFASAESDYWSDWAKDSNKEKNLEYYQIKIPEYLDKTGKFISLRYIEQNGTYEYEVKYQKYGIEYTFMIDTNGRVDGEGTGSSIGDTIQELATYTVSYDSNGGTGTMDPQDFTEGTSLKLTANSFAKEGYDFLGWNEDKNAITVTYKNEQDVTDLRENITLYAIWEIQSYSITYSGLDGASLTSENPTSYTIDSDDFTLNNPSKSGYVFMGWIGTGLESETTSVTIIKGSTGIRSYTAQWEEEPIKYPDGKTESSVVEGDTITIGTEDFIIINKTDTKITALPYYNIALTTSLPTQNPEAGTSQLSTQAIDSTSYLSRRLLKNSTIYQRIPRYYT